MNEKIVVKNILLRKKIPGENSIEEIANRLSVKFNLTIIQMPFDSTNIINIARNIAFVIKNKLSNVHIISPTEAYLLPFCSGIKIITYHDIGTILNSRNNLFRGFKLFFYVLPSLLYANWITFVSNQTMNEYKKILHIKSSSKFKVIYNSYDDRLIPTIVNSNHRKNIILHIGTGPRKNLESLILAIRDLPIQLIIVGMISEPQKQLLIENNINYTNYYDICFPKIVELYNSCDIVSFPSFYEGFGLPIIEANVMNKPVIGSSIPIIHEIGADAVYYIDPYNPLSIKLAVMELMNNQEVYNRFIRLGSINSARFNSVNIDIGYAELYNIY